MYRTLSTTYSVLTSLTTMRRWAPQFESTPPFWTLYGFHMATFCVTHANLDLLLYFSTCTWNTATRHTWLNLLHVWHKLMSYTHLFYIIVCFLAHHILYMIIILYVEFLYRVHIHSSYVQISHAAWIPDTPTNQLCNVIIRSYSVDNEYCTSAFNLFRGHGLVQLPCLTLNTIGVACQSHVSMCACPNI